MSTKIASIGLAIVIAIAVAFAVISHPVSAEVTFGEDFTPGTYQTFRFFTATTTNATSTNLTGGGGYFKILGAQRVTLYTSRGDSNGQGNSGSTNFKFQVTPDGLNWYDYQTLDQNVATSTSPTTLSSVTISAATSTVITYMKNLGFYGVRCIAVETTDGQHTCTAAADF